MISLDKCKVELKDSTRRFTDDEIKAIREQLNRFAEIEYEHFKNLKNFEQSCNVQEGLH